MNYQGAKHTNRAMVKNKRDSIEMEKPHSVSGSITDFGKDTVNKVRDSFGDMGRGIFDQIIGNYDLHTEENGQNPETSQENANVEQKPSVKLEGGNLFSFRNIEEERQMNEIKKQIKQEIELIKKADKALLAEVKDVENLIINTHSEKTGVYDLRFMQIILKVLELVRAKLSESKTWMEAFMSKKAKRGSAFAVRSKKAGTSYSMSQELSNSRSVQ